MGLSSKQVSGDRVDWNQNQARELELTKSPQVIQQQEQQQQLAPLNCPRCDSTNTKFCYYNNYNRSQPRHYCKSCKRHWTKGGTLRNIPVGGGRKNKRLKTSNNNSHHGSNTNITIQPQQQQQQQQLPLALGEQKSVSEILCQALLHPPLQPNYIKHESNNEGSNNNNNNNNNSFLGSTLSLLPISNFPFTTGLSNFNSNCCLIPGSFQSTNVYNYTGEIPTTSISVDSSNYWSWDDLSEFIPTDLKQTWDESQQQ